MARLRKNNAVLSVTARRKADLAAIQRRATNYTEWQRGLIGAADVCARGFEKDQIGASLRLKAKRERERLKARVKRGASATTVQQRPSGRPRTSSTFLIQAGVSTYRRREFDLTYEEIADFMVDTVANLLPPNVRESFLGPCPPARQKVKIARRLRQTAKRMA